MPWLNAKLKEDVEQPTAEVWIHGEIGTGWFTDDGVSSKEFVKTIKDLGDVEVIDLKISSPGGNVNDGLAIYNYLRAHKATVNVTVMSEAASIASVIAMAGDTVQMGVGAIMMIHNPMTVAWGNAEVFRKTADDLDKITTALIEPYELKTGMDAVDIAALMDAETYMTGAEAVEKGFADSVDEALKAVASSDVIKENIQLAVFNASLNARMEASESAKDREIAALKEQIADKDAQINLLKPSPVSAEEIVDALSQFGLEFMSSRMIKNKVTSEELLFRIDQMNAIKDSCAVAGIEYEDIIRDFDNPAAMVAAAMHEVLAENEPDINSNHLPGGGNTIAKAPDAAAVYNQLNNQGS